MPRVERRTKNRGGKRIYVCNAGDGAIQPGEEYYTWAFRYGGRYFRHVRCGFPKRSMLTQSKMGEVYDALEAAETDVEQAEDVEGVKAAIETAAEQVRAVADEYEEADEAFGGTGATEHAERAEEVGGYADELEAFYPDDDDLDDVKSEAEGLLSECPL